MKKNLKRKIHFRERGFGLAEVVISLFIMALILIMATQTLGVGTRGIGRETTSLSAQVGLDNLIDQMKSSAHTSIAIYTPSICGGGLHGDNQVCNEVRFYAKDSANATHAWGWEYNSVAKTIKECLSYTSPDTACNRYGTTLNNISAMNVTPTPVTKLAVATQIASTSVSKEFEVAKTTEDPTQRIVSGNRVMIVKVTNDWSARETHLLQGGAPFSAAILKGAYVPPAIGAFTSNPNNLNFPSLTSPAQTVTVTETNYAQYQKFVASPFGTSYFSASTCSNANGPVVSIAPSSTGTGDSATFSVTPLRSGSCTFTVKTYDQTTTITVNVFATPSYTIVVNGPASGNVNVGQTTTYSVTANLDPIAPGAIFQSAPPTSIAVQQVVSTPAVCSATPNGQQASGTTFTISMLASGTCSDTVSAVGPPGSVINNNPTVLTVNSIATAAPIYILNVGQPTPPSVILNGISTVIATATLTNPAQAPAGSPATETVTANVLTPTICSLAVGGGGTFSFTGLANGVCTVSFNAAGTLPQNVSITVGTGSQGGSGVLTPPASTPSPACFANAAARALGACSTPPPTALCTNLYDSHGYRSCILAQNVTGGGFVRCGPGNIPLSSITRKTYGIDTPSGSTQWYYQQILTDIPVCSYTIQITWTSTVSTSTTVSPATYYGDPNLP